MAPKALSRAEKIRDHPQSNPAALAAYILIEGCRRVLTGAAKVDLEDKLFALLPEEYYGYLVPGEGEEVGEDGQRLLVYLMDDLASALYRSLDRRLDGDFSFAPSPSGGSPGDEKAQERARVQRRAIWLILGYDQQPCGYEQAVGLATGPGESSVGSKTQRRTWLDLAYVDVFEPDWIFRPLGADRPRGSIPRRVSLAGIETVDAWLREGPLQGPSPQLFASWERDRGADFSRMALLLATFQVAESRFRDLGENDPLKDWYAAHADESFLMPDKPCRLCPAVEFGGKACVCARRHMKLPVRRHGESGLAARQRNHIEVGQAAIEMAARSVVTSHPCDWPTAAHLSWTLGRYPIKSVKVDVEVPLGLAELGALLRDERPDAHELQRAAAFIDGTTDLGLLREAAELGRAAFVRHEAHHEELRPEFAELARTLAGAFRELRSPSFAAFQRQLADSEVAKEPKALEALQDLQLAQQRLLRWAPASAAYELSLDRLEEAFAEEGSTQKRFEIEEQLHLGRLGGLILEAEFLLFSKPITSAVRARIAAVLNTAVDLGSENGRLQRALIQIQEARDTDAVHPHERAVLRYNARWHVMPAIMLSRAYVARAAFRLETNDAGRDDDLRRARAIHEELRARSDLTGRQAWEISRVELVAAAISGGGEDLAGRVDRVLDSGGDDAADYVTPATRWLASHKHIKGTRMAELLDEAAPALEAGVTAVPRLPDLETRL